MSASLQAHFLVYLSQLNAKLGKRIDSWLFVHGISFTEFLVMYELDRAAGNSLPRVKLAEIMGISPSGVTRVLAPMEKNGITEREKNPRDARMSLVKLSKTGQKLFREALQSFERGAQQLSEPLSSGQLEKIIKQTGELIQ